MDKFKIFILTLYTYCFCPFDLSSHYVNYYHSIRFINFLYGIFFLQTTKKMKTKMRAKMRLKATMNLRIRKVVKKLQFTQLKSERKSLIFGGIMDTSAVSKSLRIITGNLKTVQNKFYIIGNVETRLVIYLLPILNSPFVFFSFHSFN